MFERFTKDTRDTVRRAAELAESEDAPAVEADHLLLALAERMDDPAGAALQARGITVEAIEAARTRELRSALALVGVAATELVPGGSSRLRRRRTRFGQSAKLALERTLRQAVAAGGNRLTNDHVLLGIVSAEVGRIPRLLQELDVTAESIRATLANPPTGRP